MLASLNWKGLLNDSLTTLVNSLLSHDIKYTNSTFSSWILFSIASALFLEFSSQSNPHSEDQFLILRTQNSTIAGADPGGGGMDGVASHPPS